MHPMRLSITLAIAAAPIALAGCADPLSRDTTVALREQIIDAQRRQIESAGSPDRLTTTPPLLDSYIDEDPQRVEQLDRVSGPELFRDAPLEQGTGLGGEPSAVAALSLQQALRTALRNNIDVQLASLQPAISEADLVAAEAAFDAVYFLEGNWGKTDRPQPNRLITQPIDPDGAGPMPPVNQNVPVGVESQVADTANLTTGIRKPLESGGQITVATGFEYSNNKTPGFLLAPDPAWTTNVLLGIQQPLLRNFGSALNRSQITISRNAQRRDALALHTQLLNTLAEVERAYWELVFARRALAVQQELTRVTIGTRDVLALRGKFDVTALQRGQTQSSVERRRGDLVTARQAVRQASDRLKRLINDPSLPLSDETLIVPIDDPVEVPVQYNLLDAVTVALRSRPEARAALLDIDDASIRQLVADNQRLPQLNLNAQVQYFGLNEEDERLGGSYGKLADGDFIEYLIGAQFEMPIGNRAAQAIFRRTRIERQAAVVAYKRAVQDIVLALKDALREQQAAYELIGSARQERRALADTVRVLDERLRVIEGLTPEFLDLQLTYQQRLADAQTREIQAMARYNIAVMEVQLAKGTLLEHNQVEMGWPPGMFADEPR